MEESVKLKRGRPPKCKSNDGPPKRKKRRTKVLKAPETSSDEENENRQENETPMSPDILSSDEDEDELEETEQLHCLYCTRIFEGVDEFINHLYRHYKDRPYICDRCGFRFKRGHHLRDHMFRKLRPCHPLQLLEKVSGIPGMKNAKRSNNVKKTTCQSVADSKAKEDVAEHSVTAQNEAQSTDGISLCRKGPRGCPKDVRIAKYHQGIPWKDCTVDLGPKLQHGVTLVSGSETEEEGIKENDCCHTLSPSRLAEFSGRVPEEDAIVKTISSQPNKNVTLLHVMIDELSESDFTPEEQENNITDQRHSQTSESTEENPVVIEIDPEKWDVQNNGGLVLYGHMKGTGNCESKSEDRQPDEDLKTAKNEGQQGEYAFEKMSDRKIQEQHLKEKIDQVVVSEVTSKSANGKGSARISSKEMDGNMQNLDLQQRDDVDHRKDDGKQNRVSRKFVNERSLSHSGGEKNMPLISLPSSTETHHSIAPPDVKENAAVGNSNATSKEGGDRRAVAANVKVDSEKMVPTSLVQATCGPFDVESEESAKKRCSRNLFTDFLAKHQDGPLTEVKVHKKSAISENITDLQVTPTRATIFRRSKSLDEKVGDTVTVVSRSALSSPITEVHRSPAVGNRGDDLQIPTVVEDSHATLVNTMSPGRQHWLGMLVSPKGGQPVGETSQELVLIRPVGYEGDENIMNKVANGELINQMKEVGLRTSETLERLDSKHCDKDGAKTLEIGQLIHETSTPHVGQVKSNDVNYTSKGTNAKSSKDTEKQTINVCLQQSLNESRKAEVFQKLHFTPQKSRTKRESTLQKAMNAELQTFADIIKPPKAVEPWMPAHQKTPRKRRGRPRMSRGAKDWFALEGSLQNIRQEVTVKEKKSTETVEPCPGVSPFNMEANVNDQLRTNSSTTAKWQYVIRRRKSVFEEAPAKQRRPTLYHTDRHQTESVSPYGSCRPSLKMQGKSNGQPPYTENKILGGADGKNERRTEMMDFLTQVANELEALSDEDDDGVTVCAEDLNADGSSPEVSQQTTCHDTVGLARTEVSSAAEVSALLCGETVPNDLQLHASRYQEEASGHNLETLKSRVDNINAEQGLATSLGAVLREAIDHGCDSPDLEIVEQSSHDASLNDSQISNSTYDQPTSGNMASQSTFEDLGKYTTELFEKMHINDKFGWHTFQAESAAGCNTSVLLCTTDQTQGQTKASGDNFKDSLVSFGDSRHSSASTVSFNATKREEPKLERNIFDQIRQCGHYAQQDNRTLQSQAEQSLINYKNTSEALSLQQHLKDRDTQLHSDAAPILPKSEGPKSDGVQKVPEVMSEKGRAYKRKVLRQLFGHILGDDDSKLFQDDQHDQSDSEEKDTPDKDTDQRKKKEDDSSKEVCPYPYLWKKVIAILDANIVMQNLEDVQKLVEMDLPGIRGKTFVPT